MKKISILVICLYTVSLFSQIPPNFPVITFSVNSEPTPGKIYLSNLTQGFGVVNTPFLMILDNTGIPVFSQQMTARMNLDFKLQPNGMRTYFDNLKGKFYALNEEYEVVDSFSCNGYQTDEHELVILPNGHSFMLGNTRQVMDLSGVVPGGNTAASVQGMVIQEQDENHLVIFEWSTFDHFDVSDCTTNSLLLGPVVDYAHCNSIDVDTEGNLLLSSRHMDEITKIDHSTGEIIWRMGGSRSKNNMFTFVNDSTSTFTGFSHQHCARWLPNGNMLVFDNGNLKTPPHSRVVEYAIDEINYIATKVWEYSPEPVIYSSAMGSSQRLANGNTFIGWGINAQHITASEVTPAGEVVQALSFPTGVSSYRAFKVMDPVQNHDGITLPAIGLHAYPNPFISSTQIQYKSSDSNPISIGIYNCRGQLVKTMSITHTLVGRNLIPWNGKDINSRNVASGVYLIRIRNGENEQTMKVLKLK